MKKIPDNSIIKKQIANPNKEEWGSTYIPLYGKGWRFPQSISLQNFFESIEVGFNEDFMGGKLEERNVSNVKFENQDKEPEAPPGTQMQRSYIAVDENYLYVWIGNKWKRILLSDW